MGVITMSLKERARQLQRNAQAVMNHPAAVMVPANVRGLVSDLAGLIAVLAEEIETLKGASHEHEQG